MAESPNFETMILKVAEHRRGLVKDHCRADEDLIALATVYALEAQRIWEEVSGKKGAAHQFYTFADRCIE